MEAGEVSSSKLPGWGEYVELRMAGGVVVQGQVDQVVSPIRPDEDEPVLLVRVPIPWSQLRSV